MRVDAERRDDAILRLRERERAAAGVDSGADRDDRRDVGRSSSAHELGDGLVAGVEVRVSVGHSSTARFIRSSSSATTVAGSSLRKSGVGSRSSCPGGSEPGSQRPTALHVVAGEHGVVRPVLFRDVAELERAGDRAVVTEKLVQLLRAVRQERAEHQLQVVDAAERDLKDGARALAIALHQRPMEPVR